MTQTMKTAKIRPRYFDVDTYDDNNVSSNGSSSSSNNDDDDNFDDDDSSGDDSTLSSRPSASAMVSSTVLRAGVHIKTNVYMAPCDDDDVSKDGDNDDDTLKA